MHNKEAVLFPDPAPDDQTPSDWQLLDSVLAIDSVRTLYVHGPPGVGKTYAAYHHGRTEAGVFAITLTEDTAAAELRGHYVPDGSKYVWHDGPFTSAMRAGARLVINEVTHGAEEALSLLYPVLESIETARLTLPNNETVRPAPGFHVVCTDNAAPEELPAALQDRFQCTFEIKEPHPEALAALREPFRTAARRSLSLESERRIGLRGWLSLQGLSATLGLEQACRCVFGAERGAQIFDAMQLSS
ncbi:MAG: MoxR-like ATPase [Gammaproteobacteria bacterium]|jgi:MoxR-like ATPase